MKLPVEVSLPFLWGEQTFQKDEWGDINFLVGPNGTGKTLFAEQLMAQTRNQGLMTRYLNAERLSGFARRELLAVLRLLEGELTTRQMAESLYVSPNTVRTQVKSVYRKLGASSREQAVEEAHARGLI